MCLETLWFSLHYAWFGEKSMFHICIEPCVFILDFMFGILSYVIFHVKSSKCEVIKIMWYFLSNMLSYMKKEKDIPPWKKQKIVKYVHFDSGHEFYHINGALLYWGSASFVLYNWIIFMSHAFSRLLVLNHNSKKMFNVSFEDECSPRGEYCYTSKI